MKNFMVKEQNRRRIEGASLRLKWNDGEKRNGAHSVSPARFLTKTKTLPFLCGFDDVGLFLV